jgi:hypothetical protein
MLALYSAALDPRIDVTCVSGYFEPRERIWQTPIDRNVFGLLEQFGDAELATMVAPRTLIIEAAEGPQVTLPAGQGSTRGGHRRSRGRQEVERPEPSVGPDGLARMQLVVSGGQGPFHTRSTLQTVVQCVNWLQIGAADPAVLGAARVRLAACSDRSEIDDHNQWLLRESILRQAFMSKVIPVRGTKHPWCLRECFEADDWRL